MNLSDLLEEFLNARLDFSIGNLHFPPTSQRMQDMEARIILAKEAIDEFVERLREEKRS